MCCSSTSLLLGQIGLFAIGITIVCLIQCGDPEVALFSLDEHLQDYDNHIVIRVTYRVSDHTY